MDALLWWVILLFLIVLITVLSLYLCYSVFGDKFRRRRRVNRCTPVNSNSVKLNKYKFDRTDVEDLTSIENKNYKFNPIVSFVNEVESPRTSRPTSPGSSPRASKRRKASLLQDIHEQSDLLQSLYSVEDIMSELSVEKDKIERRNSEVVPRRSSLVTEDTRKNSLTILPRKFSLTPDVLLGESKDTLDCTDPITIEVMRDIANIEEQVRKIDYEIDYFLGNTKNLKYFEINERLIRLSLALSNLECASEELRKRKKEVQEYINKCKDKLNSKIE